MTQIQIPDGYRHFQPTDPAEDYFGPFFHRLDGDWVHTLVETQAHHRNGIGTVHGGLLLTFADYTLCMAAFLHQEGVNMITVSMATDFVNAGTVGDELHGKAQLVKATRRSLFARGDIVSGDDVVMMFTGYLKLLP